MDDQCGYETFVFFLNIGLPTNILVNSTSYKETVCIRRRFEKSMLSTNLSP